MLTLLLSAHAAPTVDAFVGAHVAGPNHELYVAREHDHRPLGTAPVIGARLGYELGELLFVEGEAMLGPALKPGGLFTAYGAHGGLRLPGDGLVVPGVLAGAGIIGVDSPNLGSDSDLAFHVGPMATVRVSDTLRLRGDVRYLLSGRLGEGGFGGHTEVLLGIHFTPRSAPKDTDGDGLPDDVDQCPANGELRNGYQDEDGCPDDLAEVWVKVKDAEGRLLSNAEVLVDGESVGRSNRDGRLTLTDRMPGTTVELRGVQEGLESIPLIVDLDEGENRVELLMGWEPGTLVVTAKNLGGTPLQAEVWAHGPTQEHWKLDATGVSESVVQPGPWRVMLASEGYDAIIKLVDLPEEVGPRGRVDAILRPQRIQLRDDEIVTLDPVLFNRGSTKLADTSFGLIEAIAAVLVNHPEIKQVEVAGHASAEGSTKSNMQLSQERVDEVKRMLVARGVSPSRLVAKGYGETQPRADNSTPDGRRRNRRVEFHVLALDQNRE